MCVCGERRAHGPALLGPTPTWTSLPLGDPQGWGAGLQGANLHLLALPQGLLCALVLLGVWLHCFPPDPSLAGVPLPLASLAPSVRARVTEVEASRLGSGVWQGFIWGAHRVPLGRALEAQELPGVGEVLPWTPGICSPGETPARNRGSGAHLRQASGAPAWPQQGRSYNHSSAMGPDPSRAALHSRPVAHSRALLTCAHQAHAVRATVPAMCPGAATG